MTTEEFQKSPAAPSQAKPPLAALWHDAQGDWKEAHRRVQEDASADAAWVHAYLHRKEGDIANAGYWYERAGKSPYDGPLETEWRELASVFLARI